MEEEWMELVKTLKIRNNLVIDLDLDIMILSEFGTF